MRPDHVERHTVITVLQEIRRSGEIWYGFEFVGHLLAVTGASSFSRREIILLLLLIF